MRTRKPRNGYPSDKQKFVLNSRSRFSGSDTDAVYNVQSHQNFAMLAFGSSLALRIGSAPSDFRIITLIGGIQLSNKSVRDYLVPNTCKFIIVCVSTAFMHIQAVLAADRLAPCSPDTHENTLCQCEIAKLHPTQIGIGELRVQELTPESDEKFIKHANKKPAKILIGPNDVFYITDGHHHARAMLERLDGRQSQLNSTQCLVIENDKQLSFPSDAEFWDWMREHQHARLEGGDLVNGKVKQGAFPPASLRDMQDDSYRSLAGFLQDSCSIDMSADYDQFRWADFLRKEKINLPKQGGNPKEEGLAAARDIKKLAKKDPAIAGEVKKLPGQSALADCKTN